MTSTISARVHRRFTPYLFVLPATLILAGFFGLSFAQAVYFAFTRYTAFRPAQWVGLDNFRRLFSDDRFWACLLNSAAYLLVTPVLIVLSMVAALVVRSDVRRGNWLRILLFLPVVTPTIVGALAWRLLLSSDGLANSVLGWVGVGPIPWLMQYPWTLMSPMLVTIWKGFGFYMLIFLGALLGVPRELEEAAELDGAGRWGTFRHVTLPHVWPMVVLTGVVSAISALKVFDEIFVTVRGVPIAHQTVVPYLYDWAVERGDYGMASAAGLVLFVIILALSWLNLRVGARVHGGNP